MRQNHVILRIPRRLRSAWPCRARGRSVSPESGLHVPGFDPLADDDVNALLRSPDGTRLYAGGIFSNVRGRTRCDRRAMLAGGATHRGFALFPGTSSPPYGPTAPPLGPPGCGPWGSRDRPHGVSGDRPGGPAHLVGQPGRPVGRPAALPLPSEHRWRYRQEFLAELYGMTLSEQRRHATGGLSRV